MMNVHRHLRWFGLFILCLFSNCLHIIEVHSTGHVIYSRTRRDGFEQENRDGDLPKFPIQPDLRLQSSYIFNAHEVLRIGLQQFLQFKDLDLGTYMSDLVNKRTEPFKDEYGQVIRNYQKVFRFIWEQYNENLVQNYAIKRFDKDKLDLCSVARYLSHQPKVEQRGTIMKRMGDALHYRCHPCTPYTPKEWYPTAVPSWDGINPEGVSPEESLLLCKDKTPSSVTSPSPVTSSLPVTSPSPVTSSLPVTSLSPVTTPSRVTTPPSVHNITTIITSEPFSYITVENGGIWGDWGNEQYGSTWKAIGFSLKVEPDQGGGPDDTALNGVAILYIENGSPGQVLIATSQEERFGDWGPQYKCKGEKNYLVSFRLKVEEEQGGGEFEDDTAANDAEFKCTNGEVISSTNGGEWGAWGAWSPTCSTGFCGIQTKVESFLGGDVDDTALNDVRFMCGCS